MTSTLQITPKTHWINGWFLRLFARPIILINGRETPGSWGRSVQAEITHGEHTIAVGARYRGSRALLGAESRRIDVPADKRVKIETRNGFFNHQPFKITKRTHENIRSNQD